MNPLRDILEQKRAEVQRLTDEIQELRRKADKLVAQRDEARTLITELQAFIDARGGQP